MVDTVRTLSALQTLFADSMSGDIDAQELRDFLVSVYPQWQNYTPELTATTTDPTLGSGSIQEGRYIVEGDPARVSFYGRIQFGSSVSSGSGAYRVSLPVDTLDSLTFNTVVGSFLLRDASVTTNPRIGLLRLESNGGDAAALILDGDFVGAAEPWVFADNDVITFQGFYEAE